MGKDPFSRFAFRWSEVRKSLVVGNPQQTVTEVRVSGYRGFVSPSVEPRAARKEGSSAILGKPEQSARGVVAMQPGTVRVIGSVL
jgi:hypothetical protein